MIKHSLSGLMALTLAAGTLVAAAPAWAQERSAVVKIGDLDLASAAGTDRLQRRLNGAAREICGEIPVLPLEFKARAKACYAEVLASSREQVAQATARAQSEVRLARRTN